MDDNKELLVIKWTVSDVRFKFEETYGREPTEEELEECISNIDFKSMEECSIERGWQFIEAAVGE